MNALQISKMLKISRNKTQNLADEHRSSNPEWFKDCRPRTGPVCEYFAPELIQIIINEIDKYEKVPDEWMTNNAVAAQLELAENTIRIIADEYRESNPEWFKEYIAKSGHVYEFYSPELIKEIERRRKELKKAPNGWMNNFAIATLLKISRHRAELIVTSYRGDHPEWFQKYINNAGQYLEYYSPQLVRIITKECKKHPDAPKGWLTITSMSRQIGVSPSYVASIIGKYSDTHPKWIQEYWGKSGGVRLHYSPALIKIVTDDIDSQQEAPEGWITNSSLAKDIGIDYYIAKEKADKHRGAHPTWFKEYKNVQSKFIEHYSPELIAAIREELA